jgi:hypothetical protein
MRLSEFYADPKRANSKEVDFGSAWRSQGEGPWRVVWIEATGEIAAFNESEGLSDAGLFYTDAVEVLLDMLTRPFKARSEREEVQTAEVVIIGVERDLARLRAAVAGWNLHVAEDNGLAWLAEHVDQLSRSHEE